MILMNFKYAQYLCQKWPDLEPSSAFVIPIVLSPENIIPFNHQHVRMYTHLPFY